jgi:hypothetical protein
VTHAWVKPAASTCGCDQWLPLPTWMLPVDRTSLLMVLTTIRDVVSQPPSSRRPAIPHFDEYHRTFGRDHRVAGEQGFEY